MWFGGSGLRLGSLGSLSDYPAPLAVAGEEMGITKGMEKRGGKGREKEKREIKEWEAAAQRSFQKSAPMAGTVVPVMIITYFYKVQHNRKNGAGWGLRPDGHQFRY